MILAVLLVGVAYAIISNIYTGTKSGSTSNEPWYTLEMELVGIPEGTKLKTGSTQSVTTGLKNTSGSSIYGFIEVDYDSSVYSFSPGSGWTEVSSGIFAYGNDTMTPINNGETVSIDGMLTVIGSELSKDNMNVDYHGYGILSIASRGGVEESWADFGDGGNSSLIAVIEG